MLLIITPNPALDRTMVIPHMQPAHRHRAERVLVAAGGKGVNVARAAHTLAQPYVVCAPLGGCTGRCVAQLAEAEGLHTSWSWHSAGETRTCVLVVDPYAGDATPLDEHGPALSVDDWHTFVETVQPIIPSAAMAALCGSLPPGLPPVALLDMIHMFKAAGCRVLVDTSRQALQAVLDAPAAALPDVVKVNHAELSMAVERPVDTPAQAHAALSLLRARGIERAVVSLGAQGALACDATGSFLVIPPAVTVVSTVGSGDSLTAGLTAGLLRGEPLPEALRLGVACGTADALTVGGGLFTPADVAAMARSTTVQTIDSGELV